MRRRAKKQEPRTYNCYFCKLEKPLDAYYKTGATQRLICSELCKNNYFSYANISSDKKPKDMMKEILYLFTILCTVESNDVATEVGDDGRAFGILQIHKSCVDDVNRYCGTNYVHDDCFDIDKSRHIFINYLKLYGDHYQVQQGCKPDYEVLARIWNGGPEGYNKESTDAYWEKVQKEMSKRDR